MKQATAAWRNRSCEHNPATVFPVFRAELPRHRTTMNQADVPDIRSGPCRPVAADKHCVFRCGGSWFSMPATAVREVAMAPDLVRVPGSHTVLAGLCHLRNEFVPILLLGGLLGESGGHRTAAQKLLVISGSSGDWGLLIDEIVALESVETSLNPELRLQDGRYAAVMGTATYQNQVIRVLDAHSLYRRAEEALQICWSKLSDPASGRATVNEE